MVSPVFSISRLFLLTAALLLLPAPPDGVLPAYERTRARSEPFLVGIHAPNQPFNEQDYARVAGGELGSIKMMSYHPPATYERVRGLLPDIRFFTRLHTPWNELLAPEQFVAANVQRLRELVDAGYDPWVEIGNEPNLELHPRAETTFTGWYLEVLRGLRAAVPEAKYGFPGLARDLRELPWLEANAAAVEASDWLGAHAYWQDEREMLDPARALKLTAFHARFPNVPIVVTEAGSLAHGLTTTERGRQYARFVRTLARLPYVHGVHFFILSGSEEWRRFFFDETMLDALHRAGTDPLPEWARRLGFRESTRRRNPFAAIYPLGTPVSPVTPSRSSPLPMPTPEPFFRRQLLADATPAAALALPPGVPAPGLRWARLAPAPAPAAALRTASTYTITDFSARFAMGPPASGLPFALQLAESDLFRQPRATGFALLWDGAAWRLQYRRAGALEADLPLTGVPQESDGFLQAEVALEPRSAAAWIWRSGEPQPERPNAVFAPPEGAALDGARARALFLPAHPITNLILEGATRHS